MTSSPLPLSRHARSVIQDTGLIALVSLLSFLSSIVASLLVARTLEPHQFGRVGYFYSLLLFGMTAGTLGLAVKLINDLAAPDASAQVDQSFYTLLALRALTLLPLLALGVGLTQASGEPLYLYVAIATTSSLASNFLIAALQGLQRTPAIALALLAQPLSYLLLLLLGAARRPEWIFATVALSYLLSSLVALTDLARSRLFRAPQRRFLSSSYARRAAVPSLQMYGVAMLQAIYTTYGFILLGAVAQFGQLARLYVPLSLVQVLPMALTPLLATVVYPRLCAQRGARAAATVRFFYRLLGMVTLSVVAILVSYPDVVITLLYSQKYASSVPLLPPLAPLGALLVGDLFLTLALIAADATRRAILVVAVRLAMLLIGVSGALALPLQEPLQGLVAAYVGSATVGIVLAWWQVRRTYAVALPVVRPLTTGLAALVVAFLLRPLLPELPDPFLSGAYRVVLTGLLVLALAAASLIGTHPAAWREVRAMVQG